jgi:hypothetical protein
VAGHVRLELRNVIARYPFEKSHRFVWIEPNSGPRDYSRLSCAEGIRSSGLMPGCQQGCLLLVNHSMRDSAQVTAPGAIISMITAVSTRPNKQKRTTCSRMPLPIALPPHPLCEPAHMRCLPMRRTPSAARQGALVPRPSRQLGVDGR